ncbi:unnamed protein product [Scytosiphon promiscuus]
MAMPTRDGFNLRRDHGFRNPPVQPPWPFPGASGAWQHRGRPPPSPLSSSTPYKNDPQAAFNFRRAPGPWRSDGPLGRPNQQQQPSALIGQHAVNGRGAPTSGVSGCVIGGAAESGGAEGAAAAAAAAVQGGMATTEMPNPRAKTPLDAGGAVFASGGGDGWREATAAPAQDQPGSTPPAAAAKRGASSDVTTTAGGSGIEVGCAKETGVAAASTPVLEDTMQQDRDGRGFDRGVAGEPVLEAMGTDGEGRDARDDQGEEGADPDQGWTLSTEWEDYLRKSPGVSKYQQQQQQQQQQQRQQGQNGEKKQQQQRWNYRRNQAARLQGLRKILPPLLFQAATAAKTAAAEGGSGGITRWKKDWQETVEEQGGFCSRGAGGRGRRGQRRRHRQAGAGSGARQDPCAGAALRGAAAASAGGRRGGRYCRRRAGVERRSGCSVSLRFSDNGTHDMRAWEKGPSARRSRSCFFFISAVATLFVSLLS